MKKRTVIILVILAFLLLIARPLYIRVDNALNERQRYVIGLGLHFSAKVDSIETFSFGGGYVYFHSTAGDLDLTSEDRAVKQLKFNGYLRFILDMDNNKLAYHARDIAKYQVADSLVVNSDKGKIYIFRQGKMVADSDIWKELNGI